MDPSVLPSDDRPSPFSHQDHLLRLGLQEQITDVFYQSCDHSIRRLLSRCQWSFLIDAGVLTLDIHCPDQETYGQVNSLTSEINHCLSSLFCLSACIQVDLINQQSVIPQRDRDSSLDLEAMSAQGHDQIPYSEFESCKTLRINHQGKQVIVICLAAGDAIPPHKRRQGVAISVLSGQGVLQLDSTETLLESGVYVYVPPHTFHSIQVEEPLSMLCLGA
jgi:quercetin dioxygenase-like cupin family protein